MGIFEHDFDLFIFKYSSHHRPFGSAVIVDFEAESNHQFADGVNIYVNDAIKFGNDLNRCHICKVVTWWVHRAKVCEELAHRDNCHIKSIFFGIGNNIAKDSIVIVPNFVVQIFVKH